MIVIFSLPASSLSASIARERRKKFLAQKNRARNFLINFEQNPHLRKFVIWLEGQISRRRLPLIDGSSERSGDLYSLYKGLRQAFAVESYKTCFEVQVRQWLYPRRR